MERPTARTTTADPVPARVGPAAPPAVERRAPRPSAVAFLAAVLLLAAGDAGAAVYSVGARTEAQAYQFRSWQGRAFDDPDELSRYRIVQYLDIGAFDLTGTSRDGARLDFVTSLRLDHDFGFDSFERDRLDEAEQPELHLLYAYLHWQGVANGLLDFRLGRQIRYDQLQFFSFDGLDVHVHTPARFGIGVFGGWQVRGTSVLGSDTFTPDGVRLSDRRRIAAGVTTDLTADPAWNIAYDFLDEPSPMFGARAQLENVRDVEALVVYRRAMSRTTGDAVDELPEEARGWQVDVEHLGAGAGVRLFERLWLRAGVDRDLFRDRWALQRASAKVEAIPYLLSVTAEAQRWQPTFDADSIWYVFSSGPRDEFAVRADLKLGSWGFYAGPLFTVYHLDLREDYAKDVGVRQDGASLLAGGVAGFSSGPGQPLRIAADALYLGGSSGERNHPDTLGRELWISGVVGRTFRDRYAVDVRLSVANVSDPNAAGLQDLWSVGAAAIGRVELSEEATVSLIVEENTNRLVASDLRGYAVLDLRTIFR